MPGGVDNRISILPTATFDQGAGGPQNYRTGAGLALPSEIGVQPGNNLDSVFDSLKGMMYNVDMIGFGQSSGPNRNVGQKPLGLRYWVKSGALCSNGADAWEHQDTIPKGDSLGRSVKNVLENEKLPGLQGLAPGMLEDAQAALNPFPYLQNVVQGPYAECRWDVKEVTDQDGQIKNGDGQFYVDFPEAVQGGLQGKWVVSRPISRKEYEQAPKTHCPNGYSKKKHVNGICEKGLLPGASLIENFECGCSSLTYCSCPFSCRCACRRRQLFLAGTITGLAATTIFLLKYRR